MIRTASFPDDRAAIDSLLADVAAVTGVPALSEEPRLDLERGPARPGLLAESGGKLTAYAHLLERRGWLVAELVVTPGGGDGSAPDLARRVAASASGAPLRIWAKGEEAAAAARAGGLRPARTMLRMECSLPPGEAPTGVGEARIVRFRPGVDEGAYLMVNNEAFAADPDSGAWDRTVLTERMSRPWFDPRGVFLAWERGRPVGLCWTKLHPGRLGEIYAVAVRPDAAGKGLGRALTLTGLSHLAGGRGARRGMLYVEAGNRAALTLYRSLGFAATREIEEFEG
jgi:mycothiol synthase